MGEPPAVAKARYVLLEDCAIGAQRIVARPKLATLPQELRKGARNIQFVIEDPPPPPVAPVRTSIVCDHTVTNLQTSPKSERKPPPIPDKPSRRDVRCFFFLSFSFSFFSFSFPCCSDRWQSIAPEPDSPQPTVNTKPVPPPKPISKRLSIDASTLQEVSKANLEQVRFIYNSP